MIGLLLMNAWVETEGVNKGAWTPPSATCVPVTLATSWTWPTGGTAQVRVAGMGTFVKTCSQYITLSKWAPLWACPFPFNFYADLNECDVAGTCSQFCKNSHGSYSCACAEGYTLQSGSFCKANGGPAYLLLADQHSIQKIPISNYGTLGTPTILVHSLPQTLAIDVDIRYVRAPTLAIHWNKRAAVLTYITDGHYSTLPFLFVTISFPPLPSPLPSLLPSPLPSPLPSSTSPHLPSNPHCMQQ